MVDDLRATHTNVRFLMVAPIKAGIAGHGRQAAPPAIGTFLQKHQHLNLIRELRVKDERDHERIADNQACGYTSATRG